MTENDWIYEFSRNLEALLRESNMTQRELSKLSGISSQAINAYLNGIRTPGAKAILNISYALECDVMDLIDFGEPIE